MSEPTVAVFRPDDDRLEETVTALEECGVEPVPDPMLAVEPTGEAPRDDADYAVLTSKTGVELAADAGWSPGDATVCAIGPSTADVLETAGYAVEVVPVEYTSSGLVADLGEDVDGQKVEVARSDHGSPVLTDGLEDAGAYVHETILYRLVRPEGSGDSAELAAAGELDAACFTSSLTVQHFLEAADEREVEADARKGLEDAVVGVIGEPTRETAVEHGLPVDVVPADATVDALLEAVLADLES
ncbi:uroporphyrinogen-III synthase [Natrialbaceae archaeon AArc-T1-2]|uniref:uroporphyrinogen-III synthase n=1 Tax=Natrialbaceae archaeon AArc-T1-2 TaxID=3053904 RepID=UPI00255A9485|nr:uroporphyrinogen-III synthase [Natrialbaceae archaeon AArc-T1-2]WIV65699.1 uroporphyrinogen-III synthase [Natrialbaceae archaeon AArc-T1-2]